MAKEHAIKWFQFESDLLNKRNFGEYSGQQSRFDIEYPSPHTHSATIFAIVTDTKAHVGWANYSSPPRFSTLNELAQNGPRA